MKSRIDEWVKQLKEKQPINLTGIFYHTGLWLFSPCKDVVYQNSKFKNDVADNKIAIYCIHGTADRVSSFIPLAKRLNTDLPEQISHITIAAFDHRGVGENIESFSKQLKDKIITNKDKNIILIGHSRGGLVASYMTEFLAQENNINVLSVVTIGAPFQGSPKAMEPLTDISSSIYEMQTDSPFLTSLREKISQSSAKYFCYAAERDALVPINSCTPNGDLTVMQRHGHLSVMSSHKLVEHIRQNIVDVLAQHSFTNRNLLSH